jgi:hippurate hydrolase
MREKIISGLKRMVRSMLDLYNADATMELLEGYPPVINDAKASSIAAHAAMEVLGEEGVETLPYTSLGGEDFSYYLAHVPGCFVRFGALKAEIPNIPAHSPYFDFDEGVLPIGAAFLAQVAQTAICCIKEMDGPHGCKPINL